MQNAADSLTRQKGADSVLTVRYQEVSAQPYLKGFLVNHKEVGMRYLRQLLLLAFLSVGSQFAFAGTIDINSANADVLAAELHGVGAKKAAEIIKYREANGGFKSIEELINVKGIGGTILEKNRARIIAGVDEAE